MKSQLHSNTHETREGWLMEATRTLKKQFFCDNGYDLPEKLQCSCGFPKGHNKAIGQCWDPQVSADGTTHIFICPTQAEPIRVLDILLHELIHAAVGVEAGHKGPFKKLMKEFGLAGKATATYAEEGSELWLKLSSIATQLGPYPHAPFDKSKMKKSKRGAMGGWVRLQSETDETYKVLISPKQLEENGPPLDPWGEPMVPVEK